MQPWIAATRPKTLIAGLMPVILGSAFAYRQGAFQIPVLICALLGALFIQIGTNYVNDASDFERGADTSDRLGPVRMAASGQLTPRSLYIGSSVCFLFALLFGSYLIWWAGPWMLAIGLFSIFFAVIYTAGPYPLAYLGLGDLFVMIFFGLVAVLGTVYAHSLKVDSQAIWLAASAGFQGMSLIAVNNLRDIPTDIHAGKKTLSVRLGDRNSRIYIALLAVLPFLCWMPLFASARSWIFLLPFAALPLAIANVISCFRIVDRREFNQLLARFAALQMIFGTLASISLVFSR